MSCNEDLWQRAYFVGELDAGAVLEIERRLQTYVDCAPLLADLEPSRQISTHRRVSPLS